MMPWIWDSEIIRGCCPMGGVLLFKVVAQIYHSLNINNKSYYMLLLIAIISLVSLSEYKLRNLQPITEIPG